MKLPLPLLGKSVRWLTLSLPLISGNVQAQQVAISPNLIVQGKSRFATEEQGKSNFVYALPFPQASMAKLLQPASFQTPDFHKAGLMARVAAAPVVNNIISTTEVKNDGQYYDISPGLSGTDPDGDLDRFIFVTAPANGTLGVLNAAQTGYIAATPGLIVTAAQAQSLIFGNTSTTGTRSFTFQAIDAQGTRSNVGTYSFQVVSNFSPTADDFTNPTLISNGLSQLLRNPTSWRITDSDGSVVSFRFTQLPNTATQGTLFVNGVAANTGVDYSYSNATTLAFRPLAGYSGTDAFAYFVGVDNQGAVGISPNVLDIPVNKATCGQASVFDFTSRAANENWKTNRTVTVPNSSVTISNNVSGVSGYSSPAAAAETGLQTNTGSAGFALNWSTNYTSTAATSATTNFYFNRPLKNFSFTMGDLDKQTSAESNGNPFVDDVTFNGYRADGTVIQLDAGDVSLAPNGNNFFNGNNRITGRTNPATGTGSTTGADGNVAITFTDPIVRLELVYKNLQTELANPGFQVVYIPAFTWCEEADVATTVTGPAYANAGSNVIYTVTTTNNTGLDVATNVRPTIQLATGLTNVTVSNGGTYDSGSGLVTFAITPLITSGQSVTNTINFRMPNTTVNGTARNTAATSDPITGNNNGTQPAAQITTVVNAAPTAVDVITAALINTATVQAIEPLAATDPQGNSTVAQYTIVTVPANGTLRLADGTAIVANTTITAAQAQTLTYTPTTATGNRTFTFRAIDDLGLISANTATYTIPVGLAAAASDLSVTQRPTLGPYRIGQTVTYVVTASATVAATGVTVDYVLPAGLTLVGTPTFSDATDTYSGGVWNVGALALNGTATMTLVARVTQTGDQTITANIGSSTTPDSNTSNNVAVQTINAAGNNTFFEDVEGRVLDYCSAVTRFAVTETSIQNANGREELTASTTNTNETASYTTPFLGLTGGNISFTAQVSRLPGNAANNPNYRVNVIDAAGTVTNIVAATAINSTAAFNVSRAYTTTGNYKVQIVFTALTNADYTFTLDDIQVTGAVSTVTQGKNGSNCDVINVAPTVANVTNPRLSDKAGATAISPLSGSDSDGTIFSYLITSIPDATTQGTLTLNGVAVTAGQEITAAQGAQLQFNPVVGNSGNTVFTYQAYDNSGAISSNTATFTIPVVVTTDIAGVVFDDVNYGGGAGRTYALANSVAVASGFANNAIGRSGALVELYDGNGALVATTTTTAGGAYNFAQQFPGNYTVRVVNSTVTSVRALNAGATGLIPVQTYITEDVNRVGGENPLLVDAAANTGAQTLSALTTGTATPQSITALQVLNRPVGTSSYEFGFNFDAITNTNPTGQGSLRQFIINANGLANTNLQQDGLTAGRETSVFMIADGRTTSVPAGMRSGVSGGASNGQATITLTAASGALPTVTDANTAIDGSQQTLRTGNTNAAVAEVTTGPEVTINFNSQAGLLVTAGNTLVASVGLNNADGAGTANVNRSGSGLTFSTAGASGSTVRDVTATGNLRAGVRVESVANVSVLNNVLNNNTNRGTLDADGLELLGTTNATVTGNVINGNRGYGIFMTTAANTGATIANNIIRNNGSGTSTADAGISIGTASRNNTFRQNTITGNADDGIVALSGSSGNVFTQNSFSGNSDLGIDLSATTTVTGDAVSVNANGKTAASGANGLLNFPILTQAVITNTTTGNLQLTGYAPAGSTVEFFLSDKTAAGFGQGITYLFSTTEGGTMTAAANGTNAAIADGDARSSSYSGTINGVDQGSETGATRFFFNIPLSSLTAGQKSALTSGTARLTATATLAQATSEFSGNIPVAQNQPLPVTLTSFSAKAAGADAQLTWATAQEVNNDHFVVERSFDGNSFDTVAEVKGQGTKASATNYILTDAKAASKAQGRVTYYRLRQVDTDGTSSFSSVQTVTFSVATRTSVTVYPNPASNQTNTRLDLSAKAQGTYQVSIVDLTGRVLRSFSQAGGSNEALNVTSLPAGTYLVQVKGNGESFTQRLIKE